MPTTLPPSRRVIKKRSPLLTAIGVLFNTAMLVSALILTFIVLVREEQFAAGAVYSANQVGAQTAQQTSAAPSSEPLGIPPSD